MYPVLFLFADAFLKFLAVYLAGVLTLLFLKPCPCQERYLALFARLFSGIVVITVIYALACSEGGTILWGVLLLAGSALLSRCRAEALSKGQFRNEALIFLSGLPALFALVLVQLFRNGFFSKTVVYLSDVDFGIYATVAEYLRFTGMETPSPWYELAAAVPGQSLMPYHYGDLWFTSFVTAWGLPAQPLEHYVYVFIPLLGAALFSGFMALIRHYVKERSYWPSFFGAFLLLFFHTWFPALPGAISGLHVTTVLAPKVFFFQAGLAAFFLLWLNGHETGAMRVLASIPLFNVLYLPAVLGGCALLFVYQYYFERNRPLCTKVQPYLILLASPLFILFFYGSFGLLKAGVTPDEMSCTAYLLRFFRGLASGALRFLLFEAALVGLLILAFRRWAVLAVPERALISLSVGLWSAALLAKAVFNQASAEVNQFFYLVANPLASVCMLFLFLALFTRIGPFRRQYFRWLAFLLLAIPFFQVLFRFQQRDNAVSGSFVQAVESALKGKNKLGVFIPNPDNLDTYRADPRMCTFCNFLKVTGSGYWANNIMAPVDTTGLPFPDRLNAIMMSPFFRYANRNEKKETSLMGLQLSYIRDNRVDFVVVEKGAFIPEFIKACSQELITDSISGHKLLILNRSCASYSSY